jgi:hypothetical protein
MQLQLEFDGVIKTGTIAFACGADFSFLAGWRDELGEDENPYRRNSVEFAQLTQYRYSSHSDLQPYATSIQDVLDHADNNPHEEVGCVVILTADWYPTSNVLGVCHFRRSWSNRIILDYLAAHPFITRPRKQGVLDVGGVGVGLLYFVVGVANKCGCDAIWGESTQNSWKFYKRVLKLDLVEDFIYAPKENFDAFAVRLEKGWAEKRAARDTKSPTLEEFYRIEAESPPFVGSTTPMFNPAIRLARRFLALQMRSQVEIAKALGLSREGDKLPPDHKTFEEYFKRAREARVLAGLWQKVEERYSNGDPSNNPFSGT